MPDPRLPRGAFARLEFFAVVALALFAPRLARADEADACRMTYQSAREIGVAIHDNEPEVAFNDYPGAAADALAKAFNAIPSPQTRSINSTDAQSLVQCPDLPIKKVRSIYSLANFGFESGRRAANVYPAYAARPSPAPR